MRDFVNSFAPKRAISPAAATADNTAWVSQILDTQGFDSATLLLITGGEADADATFAVLIEEGDQANLSDNATVAATDLVGTVALAGFTFADDDKLRKIGYVGGKRYIRATVTPANNTGNAFLAAAWLLGHPRTRPTANPPA